MFAQFRPGLIKELRIDVNLLIGGGVQPHAPITKQHFSDGPGHSWAFMGQKNKTF